MTVISKNKLNNILNFSNNNQPQLRFDGIHLTTNEISQKAMSQLSQLPRLGNAIGGSSCFHLLNTYSTLSDQGIEYVIGMDLSPATQQFWKDVEPIILGNSSREDIAHQVEHLVKTNKDIYFEPECGIPTELWAKSASKSFYKEITNNNSWLSSDKTTQAVRALFEEKRFIFVPIDLCNPESTSQLSAAMKADNIKLDTLYLSNILDCATEPLPFYKSAENLLNAEGTHVIRANFMKNMLNPQGVSLQEQYITTVHEDGRGWTDQDIFHMNYGNDL